MYENKRDSRRPSALGLDRSSSVEARGSSSATCALTVQDTAPEPMSPLGNGSSLSGVSGWVPLAYKAASDHTEPLPVLLEDRKILAELSNSMVGQLNSMFAFMTQVLQKEKNNHSSNISLMMRKVDKDLKDTYGSIKEIFASLTNQLTALVKEVERSRTQVQTIQEKYTEVRQNMEAQAQYIVELEAVLDGQCAGVSETMRKLNDRAVGRARELKQAGETNKNREAMLRKENKDLREMLRRFEVGEAFSVSVPPALPEMTASWTRRGPSTAGSDEIPSSAGFNQGSRGMQTSPPMSPRTSVGVDVVGSVMAHCDSGRSVSRSKHVKMPPLSPQGSRAGRRPTPGSSESRRQQGQEMAELRHRAEHAEERCERLHGLVSFASTSLLLLREVFAELRASRYLVAGDGKAVPAAEKSLPPLDAQPPEEVLARLVHMFHMHVPKLGGLQEVIGALGREASEPLYGEKFLEDSSTSTVLK